MISLKVYSGNKYFNNFSYIFLIVSIIWFFFFIDSEVKQLLYIGYSFIILFVLFLLLNLFTQKKSDLVISKEVISYIVKDCVIDYQINEIKKIEGIYNSYFGKFRPLTFTFSGGMGNLFSIFTTDNNAVYEFRLFHSDIVELNKVFDHWRLMKIDFVLKDDRKRTIRYIPMPY